jgi:hypothetical protein
MFDFVYLKDKALALGVEQAAARAENRYARKNQ